MSSGILDELRALTAEAQGMKATNDFEYYTEKCKEKARLGFYSVSFYSANQDFSPALCSLFKDAGIVVAFPSMDEVKISWGK